MVKAEYWVGVDVNTEKNMHSYDRFTMYNHTHLTRVLEHKILVKCEICGDHWVSVLGLVMVEFKCWVDVGMNVWAIIWYKTHDHNASQVSMTHTFHESYKTIYL